MAFGPEGLTLGAGTVLAPVEALNSADLPNAQSEARLCALLTAAYRQPIGSQTIRYIRRGAASWRDGDKAMAAMHRLTPLRDVKGAARRLFMADALMKAGTEPETILRALDLPASAGDDVLTRYDDQQYRNPKGSGRVSGRWARQGAAGAQSVDMRSPKPKSAGVRPAFAPSPPASVRAPPNVGTGAAQAAEDGAADVLADPEAFAALASMAARLSAPAVFFTVLLIPSNRTSPDKIAILGYPTMHLERGIGDRLWNFVYQDREGSQRTAGEQDDGFITTVEGRIVGRIGHRGNVVLSRPALDAVAGVMTADRGPDLCPAAKPDRPGQGPTGEARDYENHVKRFVNPYRPTPNALAYYLHNPDAKDGTVSFDDCQHETGIMIEAKGPGNLRILNKAEARLSKNPNDRMGNNVIKKFITQGRIQVDAAKMSGNRPIIWF